MLTVCAVFQTNCCIGDLNGDRNTVQGPQVFSLFSRCISSLTGVIAILSNNNIQVLVAPVKTVQEKLQHLAGSEFTCLDFLSDFKCTDVGDSLDSTPSLLISLNCTRCGPRSRIRIG